MPAAAEAPRYMRKGSSKCRRIKMPAAFISVGLENIRQRGTCCRKMKLLLVTVTVMDVMVSAAVSRQGNFVTVIAFPPEDSVPLNFAYASNAAARFLGFSTSFCHLCSFSADVFSAFWSHCLLRAKLFSRRFFFFRTGCLAYLLVLLCNQTF